MGGKGSKGPQVIQAQAQAPAVLQFNANAAEVKVVTQLSAPALLAQELHLLRLQAQTKEEQEKQKQLQQGHKKQKKKKKKKKEDVLRDDDDKLRLAEVSRHVEAWAELRHKLDDRLQASSSSEEDGSNQALLTQLPPEVVCVMLSFVDYSSLLALAQVSSWGYGMVHRQSEALVHAKLVDHVRLVRSAPFARFLSAHLPNKRRHYSSSESLSSRSSASCVSSDDDDAAVEDYPAASPAQEPVAEPSPAGMAARLLIAPGMEADAASVHPNNVESFEEVFDPRVEENMKAFASIRTFSVPRALYALGEDVGQAVASGLANMEIKLRYSPNSYRGDAWTNRPTLKFSPKLEPMTSIEQFDQALQSEKEIKWNGDKVIMAKLPTASEALKAIACLVASHELLLWRDAQFTAAVVQWEYYANFCGGPYATYNCGMG